MWFKWLALKESVEKTIINLPAYYPSGDLQLEIEDEELELEIEDFC